MTTTQADPGATSAPGILRVAAVESAPVSQVSYVVWRESPATTSEGADAHPRAFVIDPGYDTQAILDVIDRHQLNVEALVITHGHYDHIAGIADLKMRTPKATIIIGVKEAALLADPVANMSTFVGENITAPPADLTVRQGDTIDVAGIALEVRSIPGHSPDSVVYLVRETQPMWVFGGDVLFLNSVGRTDLPGGSSQTLIDGIREQLLTLPDDTRVFPGHGPPTTVGRERRVNPFLRG